MVKTVNRSIQRIQTLLVSGSFSLETDLAEIEGIPVSAVDELISEDVCRQLLEDREYSTGTIPDYEDPRTKTHFIGGWARVGNTDLIVIVQRPYDEVIGTPVAVATTVVRLGWVALAVALLIAGIIAWRRN